MSIDDDDVLCAAHCTRHLNRLFCQVLGTDVFMCVCVFSGRFVPEQVVANVETEMMIFRFEFGSRMRKNVISLLSLLVIPFPVSHKLSV